MLSNQARVITIPKLEVEAHDVSCQHGAAIAYLSDEMLFYLRSRGLNKKAAEKLMVEAFLAE
jgi:Fe-S cluster assembly protein SufD